uniref:Uncharacterized protein n=1 Tax=Anguilla anguilla TaxID=7936 RepID=A0A0E9XPS7_ANGAN
MNVCICGFVLFSQGLKYFVVVLLAACLYACKHVRSCSQKHTARIFISFGD